LCRLVEIGFQGAGDDPYFGRVRGDLRFESPNTYEEIPDKRRQRHANENSTFDHMTLTNLPAPDLCLTP
jgi:hypothetical protein